jgi:uncharacterized iron-regulated protein
MRLVSLASQRSLIRGIALSSMAAMFMHLGSVLYAQSPQVAAPPNVHLPTEAAGLDAIARALMAAFDQVDVVALGEVHGRRADSDLRIALVRHPDFAKKVRSIVVEFGSTTAQATLDRYIRGENVSSAQLARVWKTTSTGVWPPPSQSWRSTSFRSTARPW